MSGAFEGKGLKEPRRLPAKSKKAGVELEPSARSRAKQDADALDAFCKAGKLLKPPTIKGSWR